MRPETNTVVHESQPLAHPEVILYYEDGFIMDASQWTEELARTLAEDAGIKYLTDPHWAIIHFIRNHYLSLGGIPPMRIVCRKLGTERDAIKGLFGGCLSLWRIAGLTNPGEEAKSYMD